MTRNIPWLILLGLFVTLAMSGCDKGEQAPAQVIQPAPPPAQMPQVPQPLAQPVAQPVVAPTPAAPPPTPLIPIGQEGGETATARKPGKPSGGSGGGGNIDKPIPGTPSSGEEHVGAYSCKLDSKQLSLGPIKLPAFGCRIYKAGDGGLKLGSSSRGMTSISGTIKDSTPLGFFIVGTFQFPGNKLKLKTRMQRKDPKTYTGKGRGRLDGGGADAIQYKMTMTKK